MDANQFILEAHFLDKIKRIRKKEHVGVYKTLQDVEKNKEIWQKNTVFDKKYEIKFKIYPNFDPFCA